MELAHLAHRSWSCSCPMGRLSIDLIIFLRLFSDIHSPASLLPFYSTAISPTFRTNMVDKYRTETCCVIGNYYSLRSQHEKAVLYFQVSHCSCFSCFFDFCFYFYFYNFYSFHPPARPQTKPWLPVCPHLDGPRVHGNEEYSRCYSEL